MAFEFPEGRTQPFRRIQELLRKEAENMRDISFSKRHQMPGDHEYYFGCVQGLEAASKIVESIERASLGIVKEGKKA